MKYEIASLLLGASLAAAGPLGRREVPQEHSHNFVLDIVRTTLNLNNPKKIQDPVFALLGNAAAAAGAGAVTNLDCLQMETADQAFTNAKAAGDIPGMAGALLYRALERNTGKVGLASVLCTEKAVNPEIDALTQHQDPASANAASTNKGIALELAKQLAGIGADPLLALEAGTFAPGDLGDATGKGKTCDTDPNDPGCIFTDRLLVLDATVEEISAAVVGITPTIKGTGVLSATHIDFVGLSVAGGAVVTTAPASPDVTAIDDECTPSTVTVTSTSDECTLETVTVTAAPVNSCSVITTTVAVGGATTLATVAPTATATAVSGANVQKFTGTLGGPAPAVTSGTGDRPFTVNGNTFTGIGAAITRSCDIQHNQCANAANRGELSGGTAQCETQLSACKAANAGLAKRALDLGKCSDPTIVFKAGLDGRQQESFIAENQGDFNHGSALNIAVIAGFICQRLDSSCKADADAIAACTSASAAAVATSQNQAAADAFNEVFLGGAGGGSVVVTTTAPAAIQTAAPAASSIVMTMTQCS